jgi:hypothetical protein
MAVDLIGVARERKAAVDRRVQELLEEVERAKAESRRWQDFIETAEALAESALNGQTLAVPPRPAEPKETVDEPPPLGNERPQVVKTSYAAGAIKLIRARGPIPLREIAKELFAEKGQQGGDETDFAASVNSALWRRKDVFERTADGRFRLRTGDIDFVDSIRR